MKAAFSPHIQSSPLCTNPSWHNQRTSKADLAMFHPFMMLAALSSSIIFIMSGLFRQGKAELAQTAIFDVPNSYLFLVCIGGGLLGGIMSVAFLPKEETRAQVARRFLVAVCAATAFTPTIIHWRQWPETPDFLICASAGIALVAWGVLFRLVPLAVGWVTNSATDAAKISKPD